MPSISIGTTLRSDVAPTMPHIPVLPALIRPRLLARPLPPGDRHLPWSRDGQLSRRRLLHDRAAAADRRAVADRDRRHQHAVRAHVHVVADDRPMLVSAV